MAIVKKNIVTEGLSGKLGNNIVFRNRESPFRGGKTIVSVTPYTSGRELSEGQKNHHRRFRRAAQYAKSAIQNQATYALYAARTKPGQSWPWQIS